MANQLIADNGAVSGLSGLRYASDSSGVLQILTGTGVIAATIDASQNVGIGTSSPGAKLDVNKGSAGVLANFTDGVNTNFQISTSGFVATVGPTAGSTTLAFQTGGTERARFDSSGRLLVNTTSALGSARFVVEQDTTTANPMSVSNPKSVAGSDYAIIFYRAGNIVGSVQTSLSATQFVTSSDYRLKENIAPMTGALNKVAQLKPCSYNWKLDGEASQGFIAHELQEVVPECVTGEKDAVDADGKPKYQGIDTSFLVATLTAAIQELKAELDVAKVDIAALKGTV